MTLGCLVLLVVAVVFAADSLATKYTRRVLADIPDARATFLDVDVGFIPPRYEIRRLKILPDRDAPAPLPELYVERAATRLSLGELVRGRIVSWGRLEGAKIVFHAQPDRPKKPSPSPHRVDEMVKEILPMRLDRLEIVDGELVVEQGKGKRVWIHAFDAVVENLATRPALAHARPVLVTARGKVQKSGVLTAQFTLDPFADKLTFEGQTALEGLALRDLHPFIAEATDLQTPKGTVDMFVELRAKAGRIEGGVKPVLKNVEVRATRDSLGNRLKAWFADTGVELASDRVPGRNAVATTIPLRGRLTSPDVQILPAVLGVIRNAYVEGLTGGFAALPPPEANEKQGVIEQVKNALDDDEGPPKAQPTREAEKRDTTEEKVGGTDGKSKK